MSEKERDRVDLAFESIKHQCNPKNTMSYMIGMLLGSASNFSGGCGDLMTTHEKMFHLMLPDLRPQVSFGTGKDGYEKYGFKRVIVDFLDKERNIAYEIDGENHRGKLQSLKDRVKTGFLNIEYDIKTIRFTNEEVEEMLIKRLREIEGEEGLSAYFNQ